MSASIAHKVAKLTFHNLKTPCSNDVYIYIYIYLNRNFGKFQKRLFFSIAMIWSFKRLDNNL